MDQHVSLPSNHITRPLPLPQHSSSLSLTLHCRRPPASPSLAPASPLLLSSHFSRDPSSSPSYIARHRHPLAGGRRCPDPARSSRLHPNPVDFFKIYERGVVGTMPKPKHHGCSSRHCHRSRRQIPGATTVSPSLDHSLFHQALGLLYRLLCHSASHRLSPSLSSTIASL